MNKTGPLQEFEELLAQYNRAFHDRDLAALRALYVPDVEVPYFDNHAGCDSTNFQMHLERVATFLETGNVMPILVENVRASFFPERHAAAWWIRHIHFSQDPMKHAHG